jgi:hypothetical protein
MKTTAFKKVYYHKYSSSIKIARRGKGKGKEASTIPRMKNQKKRINMSSKYIQKHPYSLYSLSQLSRKSRSKCNRRSRIPIGRLEEIVLMIIGMDRCKEEGFKRAGPLLSFIAKYFDNSTMKETMKAAHWRIPF